MFLCSFASWKILGCAELENKKKAGWIIKTIITSIRLPRWIFLRNDPLTFRQNPGCHFSRSTFVQSGTPWRQEIDRNTSETKTRISFLVDNSLVHFTLMAGYRDFIFLIFISAAFFFLPFDDSERIGSLGDVSQFSWRSAIPQQLCEQEKLLNNLMFVL